MAQFIYSAFCDESGETSLGGQIAACKLNGINYSTFMNGLSKAGVEMNRKMLSEIAISDAAGFTALVETAKKALGK